MKEKITNIICEIMKINSETLLQNLENPTIWDSLIKVEAIFAVEDECFIQFDEDELEKITTPRDLIEISIVKERYHEA